MLTAYAKRRRRDGLTLLELIGVIIIFAILLGLVFPANDALRRSMRERQAKAEVLAIATAMRDYHATYGQWPLQNTLSRTDAQLLLYGGPLDRCDDARSEFFDQADLIRALLPDSHPDNVHTNNPRQIRFLTIDTDRLDGDGRFVDPWSNDRQSFPYVVVVNAAGLDSVGFATDGSGTVRTIEPALIRHGSVYTNEIVTLKSPVAVFSWSQTAVATNRVSNVPLH